MIRVRCGTPVTIDPMSPEHIASTFVFDTKSLQLYLDLNNGTRVPVRDPLTLKEIETDGLVTNYITVLGPDGNTRSHIDVNDDGVLTFDTPLQMEAEELPEQDPYTIAVFNEDGKLEYVTLERLEKDIANLTQFDIEYKSVVKGLSTSMPSPEKLVLAYEREDVVSSFSIQKN